MREFNKVFVVALPRCATVTMSEALGLLGIRTAHLGRIYGEATEEHNNPERLAEMYAHMRAGNYRFPILEHCDGLADYPACCTEVVRALDLAYPGSLFINVTRDDDTQRWIQSVERQFVGLQLMKQGTAADEASQSFMQVMLAMRKLTFGDAKFSAKHYLHAYASYQSWLLEYFQDRADYLSVELGQLEAGGFPQLEDFLDCQGASENAAFPNSNLHSSRPFQAFMNALAAGKIQSQTGITPS